MQYRLSTIFLVFFVVAASLAAFDCFGVWIAVVLFCMALCLNRCKSLTVGIFYSILLLFFGIICPEVFSPALSQARESYRVKQCVENLKEIGVALHRYHSSHGHFPMQTIQNSSGKALWSWRVEILPELEYQEWFDKLKKDEPWDSPHNLEIVNPKEPQYSCYIWVYSCPSEAYTKSTIYSIYTAANGPGTAWRKDRPVSLNNLPDGGSHTVMVLETSLSGMNWAQPANITVDQILEKMKTPQGIDQFSCHAGLYVLLADGSVWSISKEMPIALWEKLFAGDIKSIDDLNANADKPPSDWAIVVYYGSFKARVWEWIKMYVPKGCAVLVWLFSLVLLFRRAVKSRIKSDITKPKLSKSCQMPDVSHFSPLEVPKGSIKPTRIACLIVHFDL